MFGGVVEWSKALSLGPAEQGSIPGKRKEKLEGSSFPKVSPTPRKPGNTGTKGQFAEPGSTLGHSSLQSVEHFHWSRICSLWHKIQRNEEQQCTENRWNRLLKLLTRPDLVQIGALEDTTLDELWRQVSPTRMISRPRLRIGL